MKTVLRSLLFLFIFCSGLPLSWAASELVRFQASDGVTVTADLNTPDTDYSTILVLYHMARASRGEYRDIAKRLNDLGYATLAVDQRSGGKFNDVNNETVNAVGKSTSFVDAVPDLVAASDWARQHTDVQQVGVIGSSYSAGLVLVLSAQNQNFADAVISFSPGEYYGSDDFVTSKLSKIQVPVFLTSARNEVRQWKSFEQGINSPVTGFVPTGTGRHGASALVTADGADEYWTALEVFLAKYLPTPS